MSWCASFVGRAIQGTCEESSSYGVGGGDGSSSGCTLGSVTTLGSGAGTCFTDGGVRVALLKIWARWIYALLISLPYVRLGIVFCGFFRMCKMSSAAWRR